MTTEAPRKRPPRGSAGAAQGARGDRRFRDVAMTRVPEPPIPTAAQFRAKGNRALLEAAERDSVTRAPTLGSLRAPRLASNTAINLAPSPAASRPPGEGADGAFLTALDDVDELSEDEDPVVEPATLMARAIEPDRRADPAKLRSALNALKFALDHPVTSHTTAAPTRRGGPVPVASRPTRSSTVKRLPRRAYKLHDRPRDDVFLAPDAADRRDARLVQTEALDEIERVLDEMNRDVDALPPPDDFGAEEKEEYKEAK